MILYYVTVPIFGYIFELYYDIVQVLTLFYIFYDEVLHFKLYIIYYNKLF